MCPAFMLHLCLKRWPPTYGPKGSRSKEINLETIRQALIRADDVNLRMLAPPPRITMRYEDLTAADDGNQDKASISDASDLPWDLSRCTPNAVEASQENNRQNNERRTPGKTATSRKRHRNEPAPRENAECSTNRKNEREEKGAMGHDGEPLEMESDKNETLFNFEEFIA